MVILVLITGLSVKVRFDCPYSPVIFDHNDALIGARIAEDEQWRFPPPRSIPKKFVTAITAFEDKRFFSHWGVDMIALSRALWQNISHRRIVSGASTLTMQVVRLSRNKNRTISEKIIEMYLAFFLDLKLPKEEILLRYATHAPFGGNVVGLETASWKYFRRAPHELSWAEAATLAVLPNNPALIHPGRNQQKLKQRRDKLLYRLFQNATIDSLTFYLSKEEPLPAPAAPFPADAPHLFQTMIEGRYQGGKSFRQPRFYTTLNSSLQKECTAIVNRHASRYVGNGIHNAAAIVIDIAQKSVIAYIGNSNYSYQNRTNGNCVDIIPAPRSTGSILKPFLFTALFDEGELLPTQLVNDIPTKVGNFTPENYDKKYRGAVPASQALAQSLNIPAVRLLNYYGFERFKYLLEELRFTTLVRPARSYGLSIILGGAEVTLWDVTAAYGALAAELTFYNDTSFDHFSLGVLRDPKTQQIIYSKQYRDFPHSPGSAWQTFGALEQVVRPNLESQWRNYISSKRIAWKTGTSLGFRDAWAVGVTKRYAVGVWVGNADGEGRPHLTGVRSAAPILFDIFHVLPRSSWFPLPEAELYKTLVCKKSGFRSGLHCTSIDTLFTNENQYHWGKQCPYCRTIFLDSTQSYQVHAHCESPQNMQKESWFVLPASLSWYYRKHSPDYRQLPAFRDDCRNESQGTIRSLSILYPHEGSEIFVPKDMDEQKTRVVFQAVSSVKNQRVFWHLDNKYLGTTFEIHHYAYTPGPGPHTLTCVDETGVEASCSFVVINK